MSEDTTVGIADLDPNALFIASLTSDRDVRAQVADLQARIDSLPLSAGDKKEFERRVSALFNVEQMRSISARIFTAYYTPEELVEMAAFYRSPLGRKNLAVQPKIAADLVEIFTPKMTELLMFVIGLAEKADED